uniref:Uncharacterized protein n=1 Tax=Thermogemmatispora argillosa TaxID=2045280 RepID=A0A455T1W6_9CHLR|nr:hypothetical protein KTA_15480 [Thermogemmatispora argillosa]
MHASMLILLLARAVEAEIFRGFLQLLALAGGEASKQRLAQRGRSWLRWVLEGRKR